MLFASGLPWHYRSTEFENFDFNSFCLKYDIKYELSAPKTPQQNAVVERKNLVVQEMARVILHSKLPPLRFWPEAVNTVVYITNRVYLRPGMKTTPFEIWNARKPYVNYFRTIESICYILWDREYLGKFDSPYDEGTFLGYSLNSRVYRVYSLQTSTIMKSINVVVDDVGVFDQFSEDNVELTFIPVSSQVDASNYESEEKVPKLHSPNLKPRSQSHLHLLTWIWNRRIVIRRLRKNKPSVYRRSQKGQVLKDHPLDTVIRDISTSMKAHRQLHDEVRHFCNVSLF